MRHVACFSVVNRLCMRDTVVGELTIKEGTVVQANVVDLHMDPDIWGPSDPKCFDPDRSVDYVITVFCG